PVLRPLLLFPTRPHHFSPLPAALPPRHPLSPYTTLFRSLGDRPARPRLTRQCPHPHHRRARRHRVPPVVGGPHRQRADAGRRPRSEEHTSELQSRFDLVCRLLLEKKTQETQVGGHEYN